MTPDRSTLPPDGASYIDTEKPRLFDSRAFSLEERRQLWSIGRSLLFSLRANNASLGKERGIIDFDLAPEPSEEARHVLEEIAAATLREPSTEEWAARIGRLSTEISKVETLEFPRFGFNVYSRDKIGMKKALQAEFLLAKLRANQALFATRAGCEIPTLKFINQTQGVEPELIGSERLQDQRRRVETHFEVLGYGQYTPENIQRYRQDQKLELSEVESQVQYHAERFIAAINDFIYPTSLFKKSGISPNYEVKIVDVNDYWVAWSSGVRNNFLLRLNVNQRRHAGKWTAGKAEQMALHEVAGHFFQMQGWQNAIDKGELLPVLGVTSVHDPEQVTCEGIAQTLQFFVPSINNPSNGKYDFSLTPHGWYETEAEGLRQMVYNNVHIMINTQDVTLKQVAAYVSRFCPAEPYREIRRQAADRKNHPIKRSYLYAYGYGYLFHRWAASNLTQRGSREFLKFISSQPTTPKQEERFIMSMIQDGGKPYGEIKNTFQDFARNANLVA